MKKRTLQLNNFLHTKLKAAHSNEQVKEQQSNEQSTATPLVLHVVESTASNQTHNSLTNGSNEQQV